MARQNIISTLERKYAQLLGLQAKLSRASVSQDIAHVEAVIRMFNPEWTGVGIKPREVRKRSRWGRRGTGIRAAMAVLREADRPLSARDIAIEVMRRRGRSDVPNDEIVEIMAAFNLGLQQRIGREVILIKGYPKRWLFMPQFDDAASIASYWAEMGACALCAAH
jgi:hypothetical protein